MVYKRIDVRREWYTKGLVLDGRGIQKDRFWTGAVYKRMDFRPEWYTKGWILDGTGIQNHIF